MKKNDWQLNILFLICFIFFINLLVSQFKGNIVLGQLINFSGFSVILFWGCFLITSFKKYEIHNLYNLLNYNFSVWEPIIAFIVFIVGRISYFILLDIDFIKLFNFSFFGQIVPSYNYVEENLMALILLLSMNIIIGVFAEELFFRGYLFNVQRKRFGKNTWIVNGISWTMIHIFSNTNIIALLPTSLLLSFVYQRKGNLRINIISHLLLNGMSGYYLIKSLLN